MCRFPENPGRKRTFRQYRRTSGKLCAGESIVEKVIVGGLDENGNVDPAQLTFVYKTGLKNNVDGAKFKPQRKNARGRHRTEELCSHDSNEVDKMCSDSSNDTCGDGCTPGAEILIYE